MLHRYRVQFLKWISQHLGVSILIGIFTTLLLGLGLVTSAFSLALILGQEIEKEVFSYQLESSQLMVQRAHQQCQKFPHQPCSQSLLEHLQTEASTHKALHSVLLIAYPLVYLGGFDQKGYFNAQQAQQYINAFSQSQISAFELGKTWSEIKSITIDHDVEQPFNPHQILPFSSSSSTTSSTPSHSQSNFYWFASSQFRFQSVHIPLRLIDGRRVVVHLHFSFADLQKQLQKKSRLIWLILGLQTFLISIFAFWLSHKHLARPIKKLAELTHEQFDLKAPLPAPPVHHAPLELMLFQNNFLAMLDRLKQESHALTQAHHALIQQEKLATAGVVAASIMHEIGNPLATVLGLIEFIQQNPQQASENPQLLTSAYQELKRMQKIKQQLLDLAKPQTYHLQTFSLLEVIEWVQGMLKYQKNAQHIQIKVLGADEMIVVTDYEALKHACLNICMNAVQALQGKGEIVMYVETQQVYPAHLRRSLSSIHDHYMIQLQSQPGVVLHIMDHGPGVAISDRDTIFDLFTTSKTGQGQEQGHGLGLAIASLMIEEAAGILWLNSNQAQLARKIQQPIFEQGACFSLWLPTTLQS